jgi:flagellar biosynthesis protein FlhF
MTEAMQLVRQVLGDDAIIVATREEEGVGVRVTAAVEEDDYGPAARPAPAQARQPDPAPDDALDQVADALLRHGVPAELSHQLGEAIVDLGAPDVMTALAAALDSVFAFEPLPDGKGQRPVMLVGPPGAGKTLAVAKLATRATLKGRPVGVISTDTVRAGGLEQLAAFTRVLKLRLITVEDPMALADAMEVQRGAEQVLIDSAGRNPYNPAEMSELRDFLVAANVEPVLVLPAGADAHEAADMARLFRPLGVRRLLATRIDVSRRLGSLLFAASEAELALCDASTSPKVADGLMPLSPTVLAQLMLPELAAPQRRSKQTGTHS